MKGTDAAAVPIRTLKTEGENLDLLFFSTWQRGDDTVMTSPAPGGMLMQKVSFGRFDGTAPLIAFYAPVSKTETQLISLASMFLSLSAKWNAPTRSLALDWNIMG